MKNGKTKRQICLEWILVGIALIVCAGAIAYIALDRTEAVYYDSSSIKAVGTSKTATVKTVQKSELININTAGLNELASLPGIGEVIAQRIIDYRQARGGFRETADILYVKGIGEKRFEKIKDLITV